MVPTAANGREGALRVPPYGTRASRYDLSDFLGLEDLRSWLTAERGSGGTGVPDLFHRGQQPLCLDDRLEFKIDQNITRVVDRLIDRVPLHACFASAYWVPVERGLPSDEILSGMFNPKNSHDPYFLERVCLERKRRRGQ